MILNIKQFVVFLVISPQGNNFNK